MTREEAERYSKICAQLEALQEKIRKKPKTVAVVKGSDPNFPYTEHAIKVSGLSLNDQDVKQEHQLIRARNRERVALEEKLLQIEDPEIQTILWLYYHDRMTQEEIGEKLHYSQRTISARINGFFKENELER